ncbi:MAG: lipoate--protein ligase family protein [Chlamydiia bacterium]|nr:lipoate--protein ligase family protein [Chlamydiia bacterium]MCP5509511.1 lipoate--protein ligase family protein [Chlamydiales bacterium]
MNVLHLRNFPILEQLQIEEALLRCDEEEWCIINEGSTPAIVMGISGKAETLIQTHLNTLPIIKRYSGGGTVVVDENTLFVSFICKAVLHCPKSIMQWSADLYQPVFNHPEFSLKEHDYAIGEKKCGGNAQYLRKNRFVHHTTFLWDYNPDHMALLKMPPKIPTYRQNRTHADFICKLTDLLDSKAAFIDRLKAELSQRYSTKTVTVDDALPFLSKEHRKSTTIVYS